VTSEPVSFLTLSNVQPSQAAAYRVVIKNAANAQPGIISSNAFLTLLPDSDGDGLPDEWEIAYGLNPTNAADATLDADGDGVGNRDEYLAGTRPDEAHSLLRIESIRRENALGWRLQFSAASNHTYSVQERDAFEPAAAWRRAADIPAMPTNRSVEIDRSGAGASPRFFRLATPRTP
jgi:hypothetical protein